MTDLDLLRRHLLGLGKVLLGYSGGVDSALLAVVGSQALGAGRFLAVIGRSPSYPEVQWRSAVDLAGRFGVPLLELDTRELDDPRYLRNDTDRCYFCKGELWARLADVARRRGLDTVIDGTNADDLGEHRPGLRAGREHGIRSPLADLGWTKEAVRAASRTLGLPTWDAPAAPCLSSRVRYGLGIT
ncbi:MAG TPA: ATP-dependent sacrificial sulfur transferase LarE, partial [Gemmatimonadales bacterium]|nr:ATP-dependent sacrificial sulfur transferase LarE [Gemmatimonadales bacterium]